MERLAEACATEYHEYWKCEPSPLDESVIDRRPIQGSRQITDVYLLALAVNNGGRLVTFDRSIPVAAVPAAQKRHLLVL